ncbi:MAG: hypothetical protein A6F70_08785 [Cycloclasticus sp. symbiont of Bathymodiolus heckerae]|nr:MAG: hypothetical protein A6F70_08785 [Cycloclasticus sp. symbiont of Bathymodiolus heckerae]
MKLLKTTAIASLLVASSAASAIEISGNVALTTDYVWRGISQTGGSAAIQGGFDADLGNGLYAGVWGSNVDGDMYNNASMELDIYAGWATEVAGVGVDLGVLHYAYPTSDSDNDFTELYVGLSYGPATLTQYFGVDGESDDIGDKDYGNYTDLGLELGEYAGVSLAAHVGFYDRNNADDYFDWKLAASTSYLGLDWEIAYTDVDNAEGSNVDDDSTATLTISKSL